MDAEGLAHRDSPILDLGRLTSIGEKGALDGTPSLGHHGLSKLGLWYKIQ